MLRRSRFYQATMFSLAVCGAAAGTARADVMGFNSLFGWTYNQGDGGAPANLPDPDTIHITSLSAGQVRSVFYNTPQSVMQFMATFTYQALNPQGFCEFGTTFTLQNSPAGASALGGTGSGMGYTGITNSAAITLGLLSNSSGFYTGGVIGGGSPSVSPIHLASGRPINVTLSYNGNILTETLFDTITSDSVIRNFIVGDLTSIVGGPTAYVGFTATTSVGQCLNGALNQYISGFQFTVVPEPSSLALLALAGLAALRRRRSRLGSHNVQELSRLDRWRD